MATQYTKRDVGRRLRTVLLEEIARQDREDVEATAKEQKPAAS